MHTHELRARVLDDRLFERGPSEVKHGEIGEDAMPQRATTDDTRRWK
jgi:hypothetical protein